MKLRAFVLDDDEDMRSLISGLFKRRGYEVLSYSEPLFCPVYLDSQCPCLQEYACGDIFIIDVNMPNMTGLEFIENQIRNGCKADVHNMVVMSAAWTRDDVHRAKKIGCRILSKLSLTDEIDEWLTECEKRIKPDRKLMDLKMFRGNPKDT